MTTFYQKNLSGRSMIEMLGVLAIIGVLSAGGVWGYNLAMEEYKANKFAGDMSTIAANAINVFGSSKNMGTEINAAALCQAKIIPDEYCKTFSAAAGRFKGFWGSSTMNIKVIIKNGKPERLWVWDWLSPNKGGMPQKVCMKLTTMKWTGFKQVSAWIHHSSAKYAGLFLPISTAEAKVWCYDTKGAESQIGFNFYF